MLGLDKVGKGYTLGRLPSYNWTRSDHES